MIFRNRFFQIRVMTSLVVDLMDVQAFSPLLIYPYIHSILSNASSLEYLYVFFRPADACVTLIDKDLE